MVIVPNYIAKITQSRTVVISSFPSSILRRLPCSQQVNEAKYNQYNAHIIPRFTPHVVFNLRKALQVCALQSDVNIVISQCVL